MARPDNSRNRGSNRSAVRGTYFTPNGGRHVFSSAKHLLDKLPGQFDEPTTRTIALIDVLWLKGNSIQAAFEIESTTSIFSGLLRMARPAQAALPSAECSCVHPVRSAPPRKADTSA